MSVNIDPIALVEQIESDSHEIFMSFLDSTDGYKCNQYVVDYLWSVKKMRHLAECFKSDENNYEFKINKNRSEKCTLYIFLIGKYEQLLETYEEMVRLN